jgi:hypothetical protein
MVERVVPNALGHVRSLAAREELFEWHRGNAPMLAAA